MSTPSPESIPLPRDRDGRDEMNLAEFPMALLSHRAPAGQKTLHSEKTIRGKDGKPLHQSWTITAADAFGLPVASDEELFLALLDTSRRQGFPDTVRFSRYELLQRMNWSPSGENYNRIMAGLRRLGTVSYFARNAFWDNARKCYMKELKFNIIADYGIADGDGSQPSFPLSWFRWGQPVLESIRSSNIKALDLSRYFRLESTISRRLYRYLDKKFGRKNNFSIDLFTFAHEHLGMTRSWRYVSDIRRRLDPCLEELKRDGYLADWSYRNKANADGTIIEIRRARDPDSEYRLPALMAVENQNSDPATDFIKQLTGASKAGPADQRAAKQFIAQHGLETFRAFTDFALTWREENWPDMRTLSGAIKACSDAFFADQTEHEELARKRAEDARHAEWLDTIETAFEAHREADPEAIRAFEEKLQEDAEYRKAISMQQTYRGVEGLRADAVARARRICLETYAATYPNRKPDTPTSRKVGAT